MMEDEVRISFFLPKPPSLNEFYAGKHFSVRTKYKNEYFKILDSVFADIDAFHCEVFRIDVLHNTRLDCDNVILAVKFLADYLRHCGMVENDNRRYFKSFSIGVEEDAEVVRKDFLKVTLKVRGYVSRDN